MGLFLINFKPQFKALVSQKNSSFPSVSLVIFSHFKVAYILTALKSHIALFLFSDLIYGPPFNQIELMTRFIVTISFCVCNFCSISLQMLYHFCALEIIRYKFLILICDSLRATSFIVGADL